MRRLVGIVAVAALAACSAQRRGADRVWADRAVDERLMLALEEARALQHRADLHLAEAELAAATEDVTQVLKIAFPPSAPEGEEARLDAWATLARLHLAGGDDAGALADIAAARKEATRDSFYRAHVETVAGEIGEARAKRLEAGDADGARAIRRQALDDYARSIAINKRVQAALIKDAP